MFNTLVSLDEQLNVISILAESAELSHDGKQLKVALRKGVQYHSGRELTGSDVVWNFTRLSGEFRN